MSEREPQKIVEYTRDNDGHLHHLPRSLHKRHLKANGKLSLKAMVTAVLSNTSIGVTVTPEDVQGAKDWLYNKRANTSSPPQHIGRTNRISKKK